MLIYSKFQVPGSSVCFFHLFFWLSVSCCGIGYYDYYYHLEWGSNIFDRCREKTIIFCYWHWASNIILNASLDTPYSIPSSRFEEFQWLPVSTVFGNVHRILNPEHRLYVMVFNQTLAYHLNIESDAEDLFSHSNYAALFLHFFNFEFRFCFHIPIVTRLFWGPYSFACHLIPNNRMSSIFSGFSLYTIFFKKKTPVMNSPNWLRAVMLVFYNSLRVYVRILHNQPLHLYVF